MSLTVTSKVEVQNGNYGMVSQDDKLKLIHSGKRSKLNNNEMPVGNQMATVGVVWEISVEFYQL